MNPPGNSISAPLTVMDRYVRWSWALAASGTSAAKLQDGVYLSTGILFHGLEPVNIPWVKHQWLFADGIGIGAQGKTHMGIVEIIGRTDRNKINGLTVGGTAQFVDVTVETLKFREKMGFRKI